MNSTTSKARPLSPHLSVYRWQYTMALSILHRTTGVALSVGLLLFVYWLAALASSEENYATAQNVFAHPLTRVALVGFSFAFFFHLANGLRHLMWDCGRGMERRSARLSGWIAFVCALVATALFWAILTNTFSGGAA